MAHDQHPSASTQTTAGRASPKSHGQKDEPARVPSEVSQEDGQMREAVRQSGEDQPMRLNEGGRTNDSSAKDNPAGAVHGLPQPALKGTWR